MQSERITIRRANHADIPVISAIEEALFPDAWDENGFRDVLMYFPATFFVAQKAGLLLGFVCAGIEDTGSEIYGHLLNIASAPTCRKQGIGSMLLQRIEFECMMNGCSAMQLEVRPSNKHAQQFYSRNSYSQVMMLSQYYNNGEDAILMMKSF